MGLIFIGARAFEQNSSLPIQDSECSLDPHPAQLEKKEEGIWERVYFWCDYITAESVSAGIDPYLTASIIWIESRGNPKAYSKSGAVGLMQVMARDGISGRRYGKMFAGRPSMAELYDPEFNIKTGIGILSANILRLGSVREALKAYGPANFGYKYADMVLAVYFRMRPAF